MPESLLTIGIPTYNRGQDLEQLLASAARELQNIAPGTVEVLVSDNASTDATRSIVEKYKNECPAILYSRNPVNVGMQLNFWKCITLCKSEYLWLIGDDEIVEAGAIASVLANIAEHRLPLYVFNYVREWNPSSLGLQSVYGNRIDTAKSNVMDFVSRHGWLWTLGNLGMVVALVPDLKRLDPGIHARHSFMQAALYLDVSFR